jgi:pimeloyl-ACP methyl ester carboxylesterase
MNRVARGYVSTQDGQLHFRRASGTADNSRLPLVFLHFTPWSSRQFSGVLAVASGQHRDAIAFDFMGYGQSDPLPRAWSMAEYAANIIDACRELGIRKACFVGGHFAACVVTEIALRAPALAACVVLDGCPVWDAVERAKITAAAVPPAPDPREDGSHVSWAWDRLRWLRRTWTPGLPVNAITERYWREALIDSLSTGFDLRPARAFAAYDLVDRIVAIQQPALLLTADVEPLAACWDLTCRLLPQAQQHRFGGVHPLLDVTSDGAERAAEYFGVTGPFAES